MKVRDGAHVRNQAAHIAVGVDLDGVKHVLGIWVQATEGAKFWAGVCAELRNRGVRDVLIVCCDGLTGFPEAIEATWPQATVQTCVVHLIRAAMRFVSYKDRKTVAAALQADLHRRQRRGRRGRAATRSPTPRSGASTRPRSRPGSDAWERFTPFLAFPPELRKIIYTTNAIESLNYQLRKIIKNRGHFPTDDAAIKLLWLAICNIEDKRARDRAKRKRHPAQRTQSPRPPRRRPDHHQLETSPRPLALAYPDRINPLPLNPRPMTAYTEHLDRLGQASEAGRG